MTLQLFKLWGKKRSPGSASILAAAYVFSTMNN